MAQSSRASAATTALVAACSLLFAACGSSAQPNSSSSTSPSTSANGPASRVDSAGTVWLCRPGLASDPCDSDLAVTTVPATGPRTVREVVAAASPAFDCFYVYPTVSTQATANSDLQVQQGEIDAAIAQAAPFSQVCRVWSPMYRQRTEASLAKGLGGDPAADLVAYRSLLSGWTDYLDHFNDGRPVIFIGHSQGAAMLIRLLASQVDPSAELRGRMVSAVLAGGNVAVPTGGLVGATFRHLSLCTATSQVGCVIAFSSFPRRPPADSLFGRPGQGVSLQSGQTATNGVHVACVNPSALGGGTGSLDPWFLTATAPPAPPAVTTPWVTFPGLYTATCESARGATWLQVDDVAKPGDTRPVVTEELGPAWGFHLDDINLTSGDLVTDVRAEEQAYAAAHG